MSEPNQKVEFQKYGKNPVIQNGDLKIPRGIIIDQKFNTKGKTTSLRAYQCPKCDKHHTLFEDRFMKNRSRDWVNCVSCGFEGTLKACDKVYIGVKIN